MLILKVGMGLSLFDPVLIEQSIELPHPPPAKGQAGDQSRPIRSSLSGISTLIQMELTIYPDGRDLRRWVPVFLEA